MVADCGRNNVDDACGAAENSIHAASGFDADPGAAVPAVNLAVIGVERQLADKSAANRQRGYKINAGFVGKFGGSYCIVCQLRRRDAGVS